ncbi:MAG: SPOR domain-containing protein [Deltaproteobacteria bacterium]|nr:SPOR domain-containing protein [Deltaproteobacteria bacterium]
MQDLSRYKKKEHIEIRTRYASLLLVGSVALVGLVFALGVLVGSRRVPVETCEPADPLAALDRSSGEPAPPELEKIRPRTFHETLAAASPTVPTPASILPSGTLESAAATDVPLELEQPALLEQPRHHEDPVPERIPDADPGTYSLQVASFQNQSEATELVGKLKRAGHKSFLVSVNMPDRGGVWYRVRVGPFNSKRAAWTYKRDFEERERLPVFVVKRRKRG